MNLPSNNITESVCAETETRSIQRENRKLLRDPLLVGAFALLFGGLTACTYTANSQTADSTVSDTLIDYAFVVCLGASFRRGAEQFHAAGAELQKGSWWFVEHSDEAPEVYEAVYDAADEFGTTVPPKMASGRCSQHARGEELQALINRARE